MTTTLLQPTEREAFEAWLNFDEDQRQMLAGRNESGDYLHATIAIQWEAWQAGARAVLAAQPTPVPEELSPEFTDTARAALLWVLWHHQGGSSAVGQPIRFALGMDAHERLNEHEIRDAKRWAAMTNSTTAEFHRAQPAHCDGGTCGAGGYCANCPKRDAALVPVPLTDEQFADLVADASIAADLAANPFKLLKFARAILTAQPAPVPVPPGWMPIETAPRNTPVLLLTNEKWKDCRPGTQFVGINRGGLSEWGFYAPVGMGGIPDAWLDGWMPLPPPPGIAASPEVPGHE